ncbi:MAG: tripartite tricarboxylate transporter substrate binding protein [Betaproteobacteria bacterium]|nr:tripartite tricarboxylate transporter substrate binding protein [Betaproteobacteria bacterium]
MKTAFRVLSMFAAAALVLGAGGSMAQTYPNKPIRLVVAYAPGGGTDNVARILSQKLAERMGQPVTVENKPGANGIIGSEYTAKSAPDGYTLQVGTDSEMVLNVGLYERLPYDPLKDFVPVTVVSSNPLVFAVHPTFQAKSMKELIAMARTKPGGLFYSAGATVFQVATELLKKQQSVDIVYVAFKGTGPAITAALAGEVPIATVSIGPVLSHLRAGKLRGLAITSPKRSPLLPEIPTMAEAGMGNFEVVPWTGLYAPAGTPAAIVEKLNSEVAVVLKQEDVLKRYAALGLTPGGIPSAEAAALLKSDVAKWSKLLKELGIRAQ